MLVGVFIAYLETPKQSDVISEVKNKKSVKKTLKKKTAKKK
jgi:hypothetical protein